MGAADRNMKCPHIAGSITVFKNIYKNNDY